MLTDRHPAGHQGAGHRCTVAGRVGHPGRPAPVRLAADDPAAVVQGHSPETGWRELAEACIALRTGADWVACNVDSTLPTDRGLLPGNGAMVAALIAATGLQPRVAGKPERPLLDAAIRLVDSTAPAGRRRSAGHRHRLRRGRRLAEPAGVHRGFDHRGSAGRPVPEQRPTYLAFDLRGLVEEDHAVRIPAAASSPAAAWNGRSTDSADSLVLAGRRAAADGAVSDASALRALAMLTARAWASGVDSRARVRIPPPRPHCSAVCMRHSSGATSVPPQSSPLARSRQLLRLRSPAALALHLSRRPVVRVAAVR